MNMRIFFGKVKRKIMRRAATCYLRYSPAWLRRFFWWFHPEACRQRRLEQAMRKKDCISVAFIITEMSVWKGESIFTEMLRHPRFSPFIWLMKDTQIKDDVLSRSKQDAVRDYANAHGYCCADNISLETLREQYHPDIIFLAKPYPGLTRYSTLDFTQELVCYLPYAYSCVLVPEGTRFNGIGELFWKRLAENQSVRRAIGSMLFNGGYNLAVTGAPSLDALMVEHQNEEREEIGVWKIRDAACKKVIWAPHWTIPGSASWFRFSTFHLVAEAMQEMAVLYKEQIHFAFKPHPLLKNTLYHLPDWGKERTDAYYAWWAEQTHTQLETGAYAALFRQSDAMIHDCGSFINEYLCVNKPCMYLMQSPEAFMTFDPFTQTALKSCYVHGYGSEDIHAFLQKVIRGQEDELQLSRECYRRRYLLPPHNVSAAQNVVNLILGK